MKGREVMNLKAVLVEKVSKNGNPYQAVEVYITDTIKKMVFLTDAEIELLKLSRNK